MIYTSEKIREFLKSPAARRFITYITPIYGDAETALHIFESIGLEIDELITWTEQMWLQINPQTATWSLPYWEQENGLKTDIKLPLPQRQQTLIAKIKTRAPINPAKLESIVFAITGLHAEILERTHKNTFKIMLLGQTERITELRKFIDAAKPAHLIYDLVQAELREHEQSIFMASYDTYKSVYSNTAEWTIEPLHTYTLQKKIAVASMEHCKYSNQPLWEIEPLHTCSVKIEVAISVIEHYNYRNEVH